MSLPQDYSGAAIAMRRCDVRHAFHHAVPSNRQLPLHGHGNNTLTLSYHDDLSLSSSFSFCQG